MTSIQATIMLFVDYVSNSLPITEDTGPIIEDINRCERIILSLTVNGVFTEATHLNADLFFRSSMLCFSLSGILPFKMFLQHSLMHIIKSGSFNFFSIY